MRRPGVTAAAPSAARPAVASAAKEATRPEASVTVPVVCAVIIRDGRVLIAQRPAHKHLALKWEFPGGKVEPGESAEAAIVREIREELGCDFAIGRALPRFTHAYAVTIEMMWRIEEQ